MKKIFGLFSAIAVLFAAASCQQETLPAGDMGDKVTATLNVSIPDAMKTKAFGDASGIQAVGVDYEIYKYNPETKAYDQLVLADNLKLDENLEGTLELRLIRFETYGVFFWASTSDAHKKDQALGLQKMTIDYAPNKENDAFAGRVLDINAETDLELPDVVLKRPFAQLNFATDDLGAGKNVTAGDLALKNMTVKVPGLATVYDNVTGLGTDAAEQTFSVTAANTDPITFDGVDYTHILMFYALPVGETATADLETKITVTRGTETTDITVDWTGKSAMNNVPVSQNYRTNFYGSFLTADGTINVKVDQEFEYVGNTDINTGDTDATATITAEKLLDQNTPDGTYNVTGKITAVEAGTAANTEKVTIDDALTVTLAVPAVKSSTYYQVNGTITVTVEKKEGAYTVDNESVKYTAPEEPETPALTASEWGIVGTMNGWAAPDVVMYEDGDYISLKNVTLTADDKFKFRKVDGEWDDANIFGLAAAGTGVVDTEIALAQPGSDIIVAAGTYDIYLDVTNAKAYVMTVGKTPADATVPEAPKTTDVEFYCVKAADWTNNYLYMWGAATLTWPGVAAEEATVTINDVEYYKWVINVPVAAVGTDYQVIFNNNSGTQTVDSESYKLAEKQYFQTGALDANNKYELTQIEAPAVEEEPEEPVEPQGPVVATVEEFLAAAEDDTVYELTGTITRITTPYNSTYNNISFNLADETGEVSIYRMSCEGVADPTTLTVGDEITLKGCRSSYNEVPQMAAGGIYISHVDKEAPAPEAGTYELSFADAANRTSYSTEEQVWEQNGVKLTNNKAGSTTNVADYTAPARFYKGTSLKVEKAGMTKIVFNLNSGKPANGLTDSEMGSNASAVADGYVVTITFTESVDVFEIASLANQIRVDSILVYAE